MPIDKIFRVGDEVQLTHTIHEEEPYFRAGVKVKIVQVKIANYTPPRGEQVVLTPATARYKLETQATITERVDSGDPVSSDRVPHALLSTTRGGPTEADIYAPGTPLFLRADFRYKHLGAQPVLPAGSMVITTGIAMSRTERSVSREIRTATYRVTPQCLETRKITVTTMQSYPKIYFEQD